MYMHLLHGEWIQTGTDEGKEARVLLLIFCSHSAYIYDVCIWLCETKEIGKREK
jgi:hypothetical protein